MSRTKKSKPGAKAREVRKALASTTGPNSTVLNSAKAAAVTKPSQRPKSKSKYLAKKVAAKAEKRLKPKKVKEPTPESSDSESGESEVSAGSGDSKSEVKNGIESTKYVQNGHASNSDSGESDSESESEVDAEGSAQNKLKKIALNTASSDEEDKSEIGQDESEESASSEDEALTSGALQTKSAVAAPEAESSDNDSDDDGSEDDSEDGLGPIAQGAAGSDKEEDDGIDTSSDEENKNEESKADDIRPKSRGFIKAKETGNKGDLIASARSSDEGPKEASDADSEECDGSSDADSDESSEASNSEEEEDGKASPPGVKAAKRKAEEISNETLKKPKTAETSSETGKGSNLFVGNLSWSVDEEWLTHEFEGFGELVGVRVMTDYQTGRSRGFVSHSEIYDD